MIFSHIVAALSAFIQSIKYGRVLNIRGKEFKRYVKKSISLGLCYAGFGTAGNVREAWGAGKAAFLCCAYDVVTDWRNFASNERRVFEGILRSMKLEPELQSLAIGLYEKELLNQLEDDGLDRGYIALRFTLKLMGCEKARERAWGNVDEIGRLFQIVDDVLDYEQDLVYGDMNCLTSVKQEFYLEELLTKFETAETRKLFGHSRSVLIIAIERARNKAVELLKTKEVIQEVADPPLQTS